MVRCFLVDEYPQWLHNLCSGKHRRGKGQYASGLVLCCPVYQLLRYLQVGLLPTMVIARTCEDLPQLEGWAISGVSATFSIMNEPSGARAYSRLA